MPKAESRSSIPSPRSISKSAGRQVLGKKLERVIPYKNIESNSISFTRRRRAITISNWPSMFRLPLLQTERHGSSSAAFIPFLIRKGMFLGCLATFADVTEKGLLSREISKSRDLSTIGVLARWMAHEIRNPLSSLNINIELLREELGEEVHLSQKEEIHSLLNFISYETLRLENNLKEFLDFNRLPPLKFEWVQLNEVLDSVVRLLRPDAQMKNARIETHFQKKVAPAKDRCEPIQSGHFQSPRSIASRPSRKRVKSISSPGGQRRMSLLSSRTMGWGYRKSIFPRSSISCSAQNRRGLGWGSRSPKRLFQTTTERSL